MLRKISAHTEYMKKHYHKDTAAAKVVRDFILEAYEFKKIMGDNCEQANLEIEKFELLEPYFKKFEGKYDNLAAYLAAWCASYPESKVSNSLANTFALLMDIPKQDQVKDVKVFMWKDKGQPEYD